MKQPRKGKTRKCGVKRKVGDHDFARCSKAEHSTELKDFSPSSSIAKYVKKSKKRSRLISHGVPSRIQNALRMSLRCFLLSDYLCQFYNVPDDNIILKLDNYNAKHDSTAETVMNAIANVVVAPFHNHDTNQPSPSSERQRHRLKFSPVISEPLESMVDGVIAALVNRSQRYNRLTNSYAIPGRAPSPDDANSYYYLSTNVLSLGYNFAGNHRQSTTGVGVKSYCANMPPGISCNTPNTIALFSKTNPIMIRLHAIVGEDILRNMLLNTIMLIPAVSSSRDFSTSNYLQVCGPPLNEVVKQQANEKRKKQQKRLAVGSNSLAYTHKKQKTVHSKASGEQPKSSHTDACRQHHSRQHDQQQWDPNEPLPRRLLFFFEGYFKKVGLPHSHSLNTTPTTPNYYSDLLNSIVKFKVGLFFNRRRWKRLRHTGIDMVKRLHYRHLHKCDYHRILDRYCPLPAYDLKNSKNDNKMPAARLEDLVAAHTPAENVTSFITEVLSTAFPKDFWGSESNFTVVLKTVERFIHLRRYEEMPLKSIIKGLRVLDFHWLVSSSSSPSSDIIKDIAAASTTNTVNINNSKDSCNSRSSSDHAATTTLAKLTLRWVYAAYIIPLLRSTFYITDSEFSANRTLYYRRPLWSALRRIGIGSLLSEGHFIEVNSSNTNQLQKYFAAERKIGLPMLRLLPKAKGVRPLAMLHKSEKFSIIGSVVVKDTSICGSKRLPPPNVTLTPTFDVLKFEQAKDSAIFGCGVYGIDQVASLLARFKSNLSKYNTMSIRNTEPHQKPILFFVSVDVHHCYDKINQSYLFNLIHEMIKEDDYLIQKHCVLHEDKKSGRLRGHVVKNVVTPDLFLDIQSIAECENQTQSIFVDSVSCNLIKKKRIIELLKEHIFDHLVVVNGSSGPRFFLQKHGIPQGSVLSSLLCNIYYGNVEKELLRDVFDDNDLDQKIGGPNFVVRVVDDFLFITTNRDAAERFVKSMHKGLPSLGVEINKGKTLVNFDISVEGYEGTVEVLKKNENETQFPWCGMLLHTETCDVKVDYSRFLGNRAADSLTVVNLRMEGEALRQKMKSFIQPRLKLLFFHQNLNSESTAQCNFYQSHLFCAIKTMHYVMAIEGTAGSNVMHVVRCIDDLVKYSYCSIYRLLRQESPSRDSEMKNIWFISSLEASWLGRDAYVQVMAKVDSFKRVARQLLKMKVCIEPRRWENLKKISIAAWSEFDIRRFAVA